MSRDPLEGVRPDDLSGPPDAPAPTGYSTSPAPSGAPTPDRGLKLAMFVVIGTCILFAVAGAVLYEVQKPAKPVAASVSGNDTDSTGNEADTTIRQLPRHSPDDAASPATNMTTT